MKKRLIIAADIVLIIATVIPVALLIWDCVRTAINGVIPSGFFYGPDYSEMIYGWEAFCYSFLFDCYFLFFLVILWGILFAITIGFTIFTVVYGKK